ncbi:MAG: hypothetical protein V1492_01635 [Candidatus Micrarchaeota archaeon]
MSFATRTTEKRPRSPMAAGTKFDKSGLLVERNAIGYERMLRQIDKIVFPLTMRIIRASLDNLTPTCDRCPDSTEKLKITVVSALYYITCVAENGGRKYKTKNFAQDLLSYAETISVVKADVASELVGIGTQLQAIKEV